jgi:GTPase SAR1 family protein
LDDSFKDKNNDDILKYLKELKEKGTVDVYRARLVLVGAGNVGKTTLVTRLKGKDFVAERHMTNGIDISEIKLHTKDAQEITFTTFDFAGQEDYIHTHALFFQKDSIFLVLHKHDSNNPTNISKTEKDLENFLRMIESCAINAHVVFALTHCADPNMRWDKERMKKLIDHHQKLHFVIESSGKPFEIDSKSGDGIDSLKSTILKEAMKYEKVKITVPRSFFELKETLEKETKFSITEKEFNRVAKTFLNSDMIKLALDIFISWGIVYILSNKDIVLKPQKLADVLSCLFTKEDTILAQLRDYVPLWAGYLKHDRAMLDAIWGKRDKDGKYEYPRELWNPVNGNSIPFLDVLHESGLAYPIYDMNGKPLSSSVIPAMLPASPLKVGNFLTMKEKEMFQALFPEKDVYKTIHTTIDISFHPCLPPTFIGQLQSRLSYLALNGGAWKFGCSLQFNDAKSGAIFFLNRTDDSVIRLVSGGSDISKTDARDAVVVAIHNLIKDKFDSLVCSVYDVNDVNDVNEKGKSQKVAFRWSVYESNKINKPEKASFRWLSYTNNKKEKRPLKNDIIDKDGYSISFFSKSLISKENALMNTKDSIRNLNEKVNDNLMSVSNALWTAIPDLNEITIGQTVNSKYKVEGLWLVFKDDGCNNFHALHFNYKDGLNEWKRDVNYGQYATDNMKTCITFKSSSTNLIANETSKATLDILKRIFSDKYNITLPSIIKSKNQWASLVSMKLEDIVVEKLRLYEDDNYPIKPKLNTTDNVIRLVLTIILSIYITTTTIRLIHNNQASCFNGNILANVVREEGQSIRNEMNENFKMLYENLTLFISSKDRTYPTTFVVFTADKSIKEKTKGNVAMYFNN